MKRSFSFGLAGLVFLGLLSIGAGWREVYNPRQIQHGNTPLTTWSIPVAVAGNVVSNSVITQSGSNITVTGSATVTGPITNTASGGPAISQTSATGTNYFAGKVGIGTAAPAVQLHVENAGEVHGRLRSAGAGNYSQLSMQNNVPNATMIRMYGTTEGGTHAGVIRSGTGAILTQGTGLYIGSASTTSVPIYFGTSDTAWMLLTGGNLGIGRSPLATLDVNGGLNVGSNPYASTVGNVNVQSTVMVGNGIYTTNGPVGIGSGSAGSMLDVTGFQRMISSSVVPTGNADALEYGFYTPDRGGVMIAYNRGTDEWLPIKIKGSGLQFYQEANEIARVTNSTFYASKMGSTNGITIGGVADPGTTNALVFGAVRAYDGYFTNDCSALTFTDRSDAPRDDVEALAIVESLEILDGKVDHSKLHPAVFGKKVEWYDTGLLITNIFPAVTNRYQQWLVTTIPAKTNTVTFTNLIVAVTNNIGTAEEEVIPEHEEIGTREEVIPERQEHGTIWRTNIVPARIEIGPKIASRIVADPTGRNLSLLVSAQARVIKLQQAKLDSMDARLKALEK